MSNISICTDAVVFSPTGEGELFVLLVTRKNDPFKGLLALPGGFLDENESLADCAARELKEETGLEAKPMLQLAERSEPGRDPRGRVISFPFIFTVKDRPEVTASDDAEKAEWVEVSSLNPHAENPIPLAFDHIEIIGEAMDALLYDAIAQGNIPPGLVTPPGGLEIPGNASL